MIGGEVKLDLSGLTYLRGGKMNIAIRKSINTAAAPVKQTLQSAAPKASGALAKSIKIKSKYFAATQTWCAIVGPSRAKKKPPKPRKSNRGRKAKPRKPFSPTRYAAQLEFGTKKMKAHPWLRPTLNSTKGIYQSILRSELRKQISLILP